MYTFERFAVTERTDPWNGVSLEERVAVLTAASSRKKVVYIYELADTSTFRYRAYNMCQALAESQEFSGTFFFERELGVVAEHLAFADAVVFVRTRWSVEMAAFLSLVKKRGIPTLFDSDDLVFDVESLPLIMNTLDIDLDRPENYSYWFSYVSRLWFLGSLCDGFIATNEFLAGRMRAVFEKPAFVVNNFLNAEQIRISQALWEQKQTLKSEHPFTIGYFSGSPSHVNDFKKAALEIKELLDRYPDIRLEVVGFMEFPRYFKKYIQAGRIVYRSLVDFLTLQEKTAAVDVNIVPLVVNEFTNCKSELKFFEAAVVGTPTCASPIYSYAQSIQNGVTGFLCEEGEWFSTVEKIYTGAVDTPGVVSAVKEYCLKQYSPETQRVAIEDVFRKVMR